MKKEGQDKTLIHVIYCLVVALIICIGILVYPNYSGHSAKMELEVAKQEYQRSLAELDRKYESRVNNLQEQIIARQFISNKRYDLTEDTLNGMKREIDDLRERVKPRQ